MKIIRTIYTLLLLILLLGALQITIYSSSSTNLSEIIKGYPEGTNFNSSLTNDITEQNYCIYKIKKMKGMFSIVLFNSDISAVWDLVSKPENLKYILSESLDESRPVNENDQRISSKRDSTINSLTNRDKENHKYLDVLL